MQLSKSARYALYATLEMALAPEESVTVTGVAMRYRIPATALAKVLQQLVRAGLAIGTRGVGGGYRLAKPARRIAVLDVISVFDPPRQSGHCVVAGTDTPPCAHCGSCTLRQLFDEVDELVRGTFASVTLATLAARATRRSTRAGAPARLAVKI